MGGGLGLFRLGKGKAEGSFGNPLQGRLVEREVL